MAKKIVIALCVIFTLAAVAVSVFLYQFGQSLGKADPTPKFITTEPMIAKHLPLPVETTIFYDGNKTKAQYTQEKPLKESAVTSIHLLITEPLKWGEMPVTDFVDYTTHLTIRPIWEAEIKPSHRFFELWRECGYDLAFRVRDNTNWHFNPHNFEVSPEFGCGFNENFKAGSPKMKEMIDAWHNLQKTAEK
ncbi:hypothetical protein [Mannheimia granulomatis]|uniref:hypothetical protein n=1 Tax=Mannheimia granulomatis TaxID=85402 RepID=UPI000479CE35|nr:hypothetical protein [Mannheimia granulomatis]QLB19684.1 hypothetical protein A6B41_09600 [Mannheimia granulomatis]